MALAVPVQKEQISQSFNHQEQETELTDAPVTVFVRFPTPTEPQNHFLLNVKEIKYDPNNVPLYEIYINLPPAVAPNTESPYYTGKLALYAYPQGGTFSMDITDVVSQLQKLRLITGDTVSVTFVPPAGIAPAVDPQSSGKISFECVTITSSP